jgi:hypothetical protein
MNLMENFLEIYNYVQFLAINFWIEEVMDFDKSPIEKNLILGKHVIYLNWP